MIPARTAEGEAPVRNTKAQTSAMHSRLFRREAPSSSCKSPTRKATCIPDTAVICRKPARLMAR